MKQVLYDNHNIDYDAYYKEYLEWCEVNNLDPDGRESWAFISWITEQENNDWNNLMESFDEHCQYSCVVLGKVGTWRGNFDIVPKRFDTLRYAISACVSECDYIVITLEDGVISVKSTHHDGTNEFTIHKLNDDGNEVDTYDVETLNDKKYHDKIEFFW